MAQTKLCIVTHTFLPHVGGIEKVVNEQSKRLLNKKFCAHSCDQQDWNTAKTTRLMGCLSNAMNHLTQGFALGIPYSIPTVTSFPTFLKAVKSSKIVHAHGHPYLTSLAAGKLAKMYGKPFVLTQHNTFIEYNNLFDHVERLNDLTVGKQNLKDADKIIAISNATKDYVLRLGAKPRKSKCSTTALIWKSFDQWLGNAKKCDRKLGIPQRCNCCFNG